MTTIEKLPLVIPADWVAGPRQGRWTYDEYTALPDDGPRYEIVNGVLYMAPSPSWSHQGVVGEIFAYLRTHVKLAGLGQVFMAPLDVELAPNTVVQPDVIVLLNASLAKLKEKHIIGAPDLVVEVASPSTSTYDRHNKQLAYARAAVPEYWIVDPVAHTVEVWAWEAGMYHALGIFQGKMTLQSQVVPDLSGHVEQLFI
ncbi:MAG: Uma2 family endonuclease [Ktedonobacteraceae bacterium]|nr:Uma2 family endonuclease [Ktedonobacteraceae bacterium]